MPVRVAMFRSIEVISEVVHDFVSGNHAESVIDGMVVGYVDVHEIWRNGTGTYLVFVMVFVKCEWLSLS